MPSRFHPHTLGAAALLASLAGCTVNPPLMFGDSVTYGLQIGSDAGGTGTSGSVGYRQRSVAVVPVSVLNAAGAGQSIRGTDGGDRLDALSVFASFENVVRRDGKDEVELGQIFATGAAAQFVSSGIRCKLHSNGGCGFEGAPFAGAAAEENHQMPAAASSLRRNTTKPAAAQGEPSGPYQAPLFFGRTDTLGIGLGQSAAEQGLQFDLGYSVRNIALIPAYTRGGNGEVVPLVSEAQGDGTDDAIRNDALSVLGQFKLNTQTQQLGLDLTRYFATGIAAQNMAAGLHDAWVAQGQARTTARSAPAPTVATADAPAR